MEELKKKLEVIKDKIEKLEVASRSEIQSQFLEELSHEPIDNDKIISILSSPELIENLELRGQEKEDLTKLTIELTNQVASNLNKSSNQEDRILNQNIRYYRTEYEDLSIEMYLKKPKGYTIPTEIFEFIGDVEDIQTVIKEVCKTNEEKDKYLIPLFGIAEVGGTSTYNSFAKKRLDAFKESFVRTKWWSLKLPFVKELGVHTLIAVIIYLMIIFVLKADFLSEHTYDKLNMDRSFLLNWFFLLIGASVGTWMSFSLFKKNKTLEEIKSLRDNIPHPFYRLVLVSLVASVFYLFFITGFFNLEIGGGEILNTKNIGDAEHGNLTLLVGIFLGFSENSIGQTLRTKIETFTSKL